jgi:alkylhydroperoxidase/carboxymuconolactone decarboxylase family protein YurZ
MTDTEQLPTLTLTWDAADSEIVQAAAMVAFYAAWPTTAHDSAELDDFRL